MNWFRRLFGSSDSATRGVGIVDPAYAAKQTAITFDRIEGLSESTAKLHEVAYEVSIELTDIGNLEMAIRALQCATRIHFKHCNTLYNLALYYRLAGEFDAAKRIYQLLMAIDASARSVMPRHIARCERRDASGDAKYARARKQFVSNWLKSLGEGNLTAAQEAARLALIKSMDDPATLAAELYDIAITSGFRSFEPDSSNVFENNRHKRAREIGEVLNKQGGFELMQMVAYAIADALSESRNPDAGVSALEYCWDNIGSWRR